MKKLSILSLVLVLLPCFIGCGSSKAIRLNSSSGMEPVTLATCSPLPIELAQTTLPYAIEGVRSATGIVDRSSECRRPPRKDGSKGQQQKKLIKTMSFALKTGDIPEAMERMRQLTTNLQGYVTDESIGDNKGWMDLRIPVGSLDKFPEDSKIIGTVEDINITIRDKTCEYIDYQAYLKNDRELLVRMKQLLSKAKKIEEIMEIEKEISRIQQRIDSMAGKINYIDRAVSYSLVRVTFTQRKIPGPIGLIFYGLWLGVKNLFVISY